MYINMEFNKNTTFYEKLENQYFNFYIFTLIYFDDYQNLLINGIVNV